MPFGAGHLIVLASIGFFLISSYTFLLSAFLPLTGNKVLDALVTDSHYKYFAILIIPTGAYFVIANWVGWQYYRNS
ncbi:hypothetical protein C8J56DRAFT_792466 [Mycena floridula]|nr:hypothetical protein C8J56DRAFT_792466 [Mycena floridula]